MTDPLGLELEGEVDLAGWTAILRRVATVTTASAFWLGDLLEQGDFALGEKYRRAEQETGLSRDVLERRAYVARHVARDRRRRELSFSHHLTVAALEPGQQQHFLARAVAEQLSTSELRGELEAAGLRERGRPGAKPLPRRRGPGEPKAGPRRSVRGEVVGEPVGKLSLDWPLSLVERVRAEARRRHVPIVQLVADAIESYLAA